MTTPSEWSQDELDKLTRWINVPELNEIRRWMNAAEAHRSIKLELDPRLRLVERFSRWVARAPAPLRILLWLTTFLPSIIHSLVIWPLIPLAWLVNIVTGHRYNRIWGLRVVRVT